MNKQGVGAVERAIERLGQVLLLISLVAVIWFIGVLVGSRAPDLYHGDGYGSFDDSMQRTWFLIFPLGAIVATRPRFLTRRILAIRTSRVGSIAALLMTASLVVLAVYLLAVGMLPGNQSAPEEGFGVRSWLGLVLALGFTWLWMPLFPRVTSTLVGMFAGIGLIAIAGDTLQNPCWESYDPSSEYWGGVLLYFLFILSPIATMIWGAGAFLLSKRASPGIETYAFIYLLLFALWSGAIMVALALIGTSFYPDC